MVNCKQAETIVRGCLPFLIIKVRQAELAISFQELTHNLQGRKVSAASVVEREKFREEMKQINGTSKPGFNAVDSYIN